VFLTYASTQGRALIDRELYLPASWCADRARCAAAGIGEQVQFATKPELARRMLAHALAAGVIFGWFTADEAYGDNPALRSWLQAHDIDYVLAISCDQRLSTPTGRTRADTLARSAPKRGWQRRCAGQGSKGHRLYDRLLLDPGTDDHQLLVRRSISKPTELAYYLIHTLTPVPLAELVRVAGARWAVEETLCATRRPAVSPTQWGETRREVSGSDDLPSAERLRGQEHVRKPATRSKRMGWCAEGTRVIWRKLDCLKPNLQETQRPVRRNDAWNRCHALRRR
jgi:hypothetical protein